MQTEIARIRKSTGLSQSDFADRYQIPLDTLKGWKTEEGKKRHRQCAPYIINLLQLITENGL